MVNLIYLIRVPLGISSTTTTPLNIIQVGSTRSKSFFERLYQHKAAWWYATATDMFPELKTTTKLGKDPKILQKWSNLIGLLHFNETCEENEKLKQTEQTIREMIGTRIEPREIKSALSQFSTSTRKTMFQQGRNFSHTELRWVHSDEMQLLDSFFTNDRLQPGLQFIQFVQENYKARLFHTLPASSVSLHLNCVDLPISKHKQITKKFSLVYNIPSRIIISRVNIRKKIRYKKFRGLLAAFLHKCFSYEHE